MLNTQVDVQSEVYAEYASMRVTEAVEVGSIHISSASTRCVPGSRKIGCFRYSVDSPALSLAGAPTDTVSVIDNSVGSRGERRTPGGLTD